MNGTNRKDRITGPTAQTQTEGSTDRNETASGLPVPVGERVVAAPFGHRGIVDDDSTPSLCVVMLDEPLPHTHRILAVWGEVKTEADYEIDDARRAVEWAKGDYEEAIKQFRAAKNRVASSGSELAARRAELRSVHKRHREGARA